MTYNHSKFQSNPLGGQNPTSKVTNTPPFPSLPNPESPEEIKESNVDISHESNKPDKGPSKKLISPAELVEIKELKMYIKWMIVTEVERSSMRNVIYL